MAGFIYINRENGLSVGSVAFNVITELTRPYFKKNSKEYISEGHELFTRVLNQEHLTKST